MPDRAKALASLLLSLAFGGALLWLALRDADLAAIGAALAGGAWGWIVPFLALGLLSVALRAWRWGLLIDALPGRERPAPLSLTASAVAVGYLVNYAAPRLGEVARATTVARRAPAPFAAVVGTVVAERVLDVAALALALLSVVVLYGDRVGEIVAQAEATARGLAAATPTWVVAAAVVVGLAALAAAVVWMRRGEGRLADLLGQFRDGVASVVRTGRPGAVLGATALIWVCYGLMSDVPLRLLGLDAAYGLGPVDAWAVMAIGGIGMALPAPGGTGSFHYATVLALTLLFGVAATPAATYAVLVHAAGVVFYCVLGVVAMGHLGLSLRTLRREAEGADA